MCCARSFEHCRSPTRQASPSVLLRWLRTRPAPSRRTSTELSLLVLTFKGFHTLILGKFLSFTTTSLLCQLCSASAAAARHIGAHALCCWSMLRLMPICCLCSVYSTTHSVPLVVLQLHATQVRVCSAAHCTLDLYATVHIRLTSCSTNAAPARRTSV
jgi:hypothetical protein